MTIVTIINYLSLLFGTWERSSKKQGTEMEGLAPRKAPQGPAQFQSFLFFDTPQS